ncbi:DUF2158 domain-containing protein [Aeromonas hydrophila]|uniref:DUF2158 domain-containing protein n=1 Tax=Aeromonas hydrophila TaxID=644 RepID=UPI001A932CB2|nr:DUF2158 domain-containing protein [Aeromonas hydrophila]MBO0407452.1 DUF2158 domain-containing protein [Aeromonas hydrophila]
MQSKVSVYPGQQVMLKSGGPIMTVNELSEDGKSVDCCWFNLALTPEICHEEFSVSVLIACAEQTLHPGDRIGLMESSVVRLRSGGPLMTVQFVRESGDTRQSYCVWFDEKNRKQISSSALLHPHAVVAIPGYL